MAFRPSFEKLKTTILYVEDEDLVRNTISEMLRRRIDEVLIASNGEEGLSQYRLRKPKIIVSDIKMPHMDGLEMIRRIKEIDPEIPIIITSAHSESEYFLRAIDIGVDKFVMKPVDNRELFKIINKIYEQMTFQQRMKQEEARREVVQRNLRESQEQLRALFENVVVGMGIVDEDLQIIFSNLTLAEMFQENEESILTHTISEYLAEDSLTINYLKSLAGTESRGRAVNFRSEEIVYLTRDRKFWAEISISVILTAKNVVGKFIIVVNDVNDRVESQRERDSLYNSLISELETAASVQSYFLPAWLCVEDRLLFSNNYTPSTNVGGDLFDIIKLRDGRYVIYIGDISGHGVQSALMMTAVKATIKMLVDNVEGFLHPSIIVNQLNILLSRDVFQNNYLTLLLGVVDVEKHELIYYNAGHPPIIQYKKSTGEVKTIESSGSIPIGWIPDYEYIKEEEDVLQLDQYCSYLFYTDGIFECENDIKHELGISGIMELLRKCPSDNSTVMLPYVLKEMIINEGYNIKTDDFTVLSLNLRRDLNDKLRYYLINPLQDNTGEIGKRCEDFIKAKGVDSMAFSAELLVNEFLNQVLEHNTEKSRESIIVIRLRIYEDKLEMTFWDKGEAWEIPEQETEIDFMQESNSAASCIYIIRNLVDEIKRRRIIDVNETKFYLYYDQDKKL